MSPPFTYIEFEVTRSADAAYQLLCDIDRVPDWVPGVASVRIVERDDAGRALRAHYVGMPSRASFEYELTYSYDDAARTLRWESGDTSLRELSGEVIVSDAGPEHARVAYGLWGPTPELLPAWAQAALREDVPAPIAEAFCRWARSQR